MCEKDNESLDEMIKAAEETKKPTLTDWEQWLMIMTERCEAKLRDLGYTDKDLQSMSDDELENLLFELLECDQAEVNEAGRTACGDAIIDATTQEFEQWIQEREYQEQRKLEQRRREEKERQLQIEEELQYDLRHYSREYRLNYAERHHPVDNLFKLKPYDKRGRRRTLIENLYILIMVLLHRGKTEWFYHSEKKRLPRMSDAEFRTKYEIDSNLTLDGKSAFRICENRYDVGSDDARYFWIDYYRTYEPLDEAYDPISVVPKVAKNMKDYFNDRLY